MRGRVSVFDARSLRRLSSVAITPAPAAPSAAAISPDGHTIAIGSQAGAVSFVDLATGDARPGIGPNTGTVASLAYSPDGRAVASTANNTAVIWNPRSATPREVLTAPGGQVQGVAFSAGGQTLYTSSVGGLVLAWDLTGERSFGRRFALGARSPCCGPVAPLAPPLALSPDGTTFATRLGTSTVGLFSAHTLQPRGIVHRQTQGRRHHRAGVVTRRPRARRRRLIRPRPAVAHRRYASACALAERPAAGRSGSPKRSKPSRSPPMVD